MSDDIRSRSSSSVLRGFAAAQCGKASPFRSQPTLFLRLRLRLGGAVSLQWTQALLHGKAEPYRTVRRQSRNMWISKTCISEPLLLQIVQSGSRATHIVYWLCLRENKNPTGPRL